MVRTKHLSAAVASASLESKKVQFCSSESVLKFTALVAVLLALGSLSLGVLAYHSLQLQVQHLAQAQVSSRAPRNELSSQALKELIVDMRDVQMKVKELFNNTSETEHQVKLIKEDIERMQEQLMNITVITGKLRKMLADLLAIRLWSWLHQAKWERGSICSTGADWGGGAS